MKYSKGTASITTGTQTVTGSGTKWLSRINPGHLFTITGGVHYQIAAVVSNTELRLTSVYGEGTASGSAYNIYSDFTEYFNLPYPTDKDVDKASILRRLVETVDGLMELRNVRVFNLEYPGLFAEPLDVVPTINSIVMQQELQSAVENLTVTPTIEAVLLQQGSVGGLFPSNMTVTPLIETVQVAQLNDILLVPAFMDVVPVVTSVDMAGGVVTADSNSSTADAVNPTADGRLAA